MIKQNTSSSAAEPVPIEWKESRRSRALQAVTLTVMLFATMLGAAPAHASLTGFAALERVVFLDANAPQASSATVRRDIYLAKGTYNWDVCTFVGSDDIPLVCKARSIFIAAGTYHWSATFIRSGASGRYKYMSALHQDNDPAAVSDYAYIVSGDYRIRSTISN